MPKTIAIQPGLEDLGKALEARGYEVVDEHFHGYVDAILYNSDFSRLSYLNNFDNVIDMDKGAIVVNANGKSIQEVVYTIERKTYDSIF